VAASSVEMVASWVLSSQQAVIWELLMRLNEPAHARVGGSVLALKGVGWEGEGSVSIASAEGAGVVGG